LKVGHVRVCNDFSGCGAQHFVPASVVTVVMRVHQHVDHPRATYFKAVQARVSCVGILAIDDNECVVRDQPSNRTATHMERAHISAEFFKTWGCVLR
jgi:hypothetical protein